MLKAELDATGLPIGVSAVFPGMFKTGMSPFGGDPNVVATNVLDAIRGSRLFVFTDDYEHERVVARDAALFAAHDEVL